jgi:Tyrosine phosphatase family
MTTNIDLAALLQVPIRQPLEEAQVKQILASAPFIPIPHALNFRTISAPSLRADLIFRSGSLSHLPQSSLAQLSERYNITTIVDLRSKKERQKYPSPDIQGIETVWIPSSADGPVGIGAAQANPKQVLQGLSPANFAANDGFDGYVEMYGNVLETHKDAFSFVFGKLMEPEGGLLFHCTGGSSSSSSSIYVALTFELQIATILLFHCGEIASD